MSKKTFCRTRLYPYQINDADEIVRVDWMLRGELLHSRIRTNTSSEVVESDFTPTGEDGFGEPAYGEILVVRPSISFSLVPRSWLEKYRMPVVGGEGMVRAVEANGILNATLTVVRFRFLQDLRHPVAEDERTFRTIAVVPGEDTPPRVWDYFHIGGEFLRENGIRLDIDYGRLRPPRWDSPEAGIWSIDPNVPAGHLLYPQRRRA